MRGLRRSESPTPARGSALPLLSSPPGRLLSGSSRGDSRPSWLITRRGDGPNPLVRTHTTKHRKQRPSSPLPPSSPPSLHDSTHHWLGNTPPSQYSDPHTSIEVALSDVPKPLARARPATPHPRSSSSLFSTQYGTQWPRTYGGDEAEDEDEDDELPPDELPPDSPPFHRSLAHEMEEARARSVSPGWPSSPERDSSSFVAEAPLAFQDILCEAVDFGEMSELEGSLIGRARGPRAAREVIHAPVPRPHTGAAHAPSHEYEGGENEDEAWAIEDVTDDRAWASCYAAPSPPHNDTWGFDAVRGMTQAHIPYQYNGNPSSDDRRQRRRRHRTPSPIDFWPSPSPPSEKVYDRMYRSSPPQIPLRFTPPPPLPPRAAWRGKEALEACLTGRWRGWRHEEEDDDEEEPKRNKQKRKRTSRKRAASNSSAADASAIEMSPAAKAAREARIRHFNDLDANYKLHVE